MDFNHGKELEKTMSFWKKSLLNELEVNLDGIWI